MRRLLAAVVLGAWMFGLGGCAGTNPAARKPQGEPFDYIFRSWSVLERGPRQLLAAATDPKFPRARPILYVPADEDMRAVMSRLRASVPLADLEKLDVQPLPARGEPAEPGLLYLPYPYVVPGGRFNEMYGWDSYFIVLGLLRDGRVEQAKHMVDDQLYEVRHYGQVLNANRSYYLGRSQPPLLGQMIRRVFARTADRAWLEDAWPVLEASYHIFMAKPRLIEPDGLSRYHAGGGGPAPEVVSGERDAEGKSHYERVREVLKARIAAEPSLARFYDPVHDQLTDLFYVADRSMRESGFDPTDRFGPLGSEILDIAPVCLNSLLFQTENDLAELATVLGRSDDSARYRAAAERRRLIVERDLWDEKRGLYLDYDFVQKQRRDYAFLTTFMPLWVGLASPQHATRVAEQLPLFERAGGLLTSTNKSGTQWDAPFGWAPLQLFAVEGLRRYGLGVAADRISIEFLSLVAHELTVRGAIYEKYDVEHARSTVADELRFGYTSNEIGFGWTNGVFLELYAALPDAAKAVVRSAARK